jgi:hypothetical protein
VNVEMSANTADCRGGGGGPIAKEAKDMAGWVGWLGNAMLFVRRLNHKRRC